MMLSERRKRSKRFHPTTKCPVFVTYFLWATITFLLTAHSTLTSGKNTKEIETNYKNLNPIRTINLNNEDLIVPESSQPSKQYYKIETIPILNLSLWNILTSLNTKVDAINTKVDKIARAIEPMINNEWNNTKIQTNATGHLLSTNTLESKNFTEVQKADTESDQTEIDIQEPQEFNESSYDSPNPNESTELYNITAWLKPNSTDIRSDGNTEAAGTTEIYEAATKKDVLEKVTVQMLITDRPITETQSQISQKRGLNDDESSRNLVTEQPKNDTSLRDEVEKLNQITKNHLNEQQKNYKIIPTTNKESSKYSDSKLNKIDVELEPITVEIPYNITQASTLELPASIPAFVSLAGRDDEISTNSNTMEITTETLQMNPLSPKFAGSEINDSENPIPATMADVPGLDGNDWEDDNIGINQTRTHSFITQDETGLLTTQFASTRASTMIPFQQIRENRTIDNSLNSNTKFDNETSSQLAKNEHIGMRINPNLMTNDTINGTLREINFNSKPYVWKRICFLGVDKIHYAADEMVIKLPPNSADIYLFYYIPEYMNFNRSADLVFLPSDQKTHYDGGYLKHRYTNETYVKSSNYSAFSLGQHKLLHSYANSKPARLKIRQTITSRHPKTRLSSETPSKDLNVSKVDASKQNTTKGTKCFVLPFFPHNFTFGKFRPEDEDGMSANKENNNSSNATLITTVSTPKNEPRKKRNLHFLYSDQTTKKTNCLDNYKWCTDKSTCIPESKWCDNIIDCLSDSSDEIHCSCKERMDKNKVCDGYFDCPNGEDEKGCFGCPENSFACDTFIQSKPNITCVDINRRCDNWPDCADGKDEKDCELLTDVIDSHDTFLPSFSSGYLHRNWKGKWYPACVHIHSEQIWGIRACASELGVQVKHIETEILPYENRYEGKFITLDENGEITFLSSCVGAGLAVHVKCPSIVCGSRVLHEDFYPRYRAKRETPQGALQEFVEKILDNIFRNKSTEFKRRGRDYGKVVGGDFSTPGHWPWLVALYKNGNFHCGGAILDETWVLTAAHCVADYEKHYFEIQAGILRRFSFSPSEQTRAVTHVIMHPAYSPIDMKNDLAVLKLEEPLKFNRWVRPTCLPEARPPWGPPPGAICTAVGWGSTHEKGPDPDNMKEVQMPVLPRCKHRSDQEGEAICAGYLEGGHDTCQGDSGGPLLCSIPHARDQWYIGGVVSHGEGCARPMEPGAYTRVALFIPWLVKNTDDKLLTPNRKSKHDCPGIKCLHGGRCIAKKRLCDSVIDCLYGEDEIGCNGFDQSPNNSNEDHTQSLNGLLDMKRHMINTNVSTSIETSSNHTVISRNQNFLPMSQTKESIENVHNVEQIPKNRSRTEGKEEFNEGKQEMNKFFTCTILSQNISLLSYCDLKVDCEDGTDEIGCSCADYLRHHHQSLICDGIIHCYDLSDENNCTDHNCTEDQFFCYKSRTCIPKDNVCNETKIGAHCPLKEAEEICYSVIPINNKNSLEAQFDLFGMPLFADKGILAYNDRGVWKWLCVPEENDMISSKIVPKLAVKLQFKKSRGHTQYMVFNDQVLNGRRNKYCPGLMVDFAVEHVEDASILPWRTKIFVNGNLTCFGVLVEKEWVLGGRSCCSGFSPSTDYIVAVLGNDDSSNVTVRQYEEQIVQVDKIQCDYEHVGVLMHLRENPITTKKTKSLSLRSKSIWNNLLLLLKKTNSKFYELELLSNCPKPFWCYRLIDQTDFCSGNNFEPSSSFLSVIGLSQRREWIFSGIVDLEASLFCSMNETIVKIRPQKLIRIEEINLINVMQSSSNGLNGYRCTIGNQISWEEVCDGKTDCRENEDENEKACLMKEMLVRAQSIQRSCKIHEFKCKNNQCVSKSSICDSKDDCGDSSDEPENCSNFNCGVYLNLTSPHRLCNSYQDCLDKSDEDIKACQSLCGFSSSFRCNKTNSCIPLDFVCDGERDCDEGEDEENCISFQIMSHNQTEGAIWKQSHGVWERECFDTSELIAFNADRLCHQFGYSQAMNITYTSGKKRIYTSFILVKLNEHTEVNLKINNERENGFIENCQYLHLSCGNLSIVN